MPLAVSNIAWTQHDDSSVLELLRRSGVTGIEIAPTKIWPDWEGADPAAARAYAARLDAEGFSVPALQAILYGRPELNIFNQPAGLQTLKEHIRFVAEIACCLGARALVFGAPRNRDRGGLRPEDAFRRASEVFRMLGDECARFGVWLCIEPNPAAYGCNFITTAGEAARLVRAVGSAGFGLHLDAGGMHLEGEDGATAIRLAETPIRHFHASEPQLGPFDRPRVDHAGLARALRSVVYSGWISIEMRPGHDELEAIAVACSTVGEAYGPVLSLP